MNDKCLSGRRECQCVVCTNGQRMLSDEGRKDDGEKVRADLYSGSAYLATCRGLTYGVRKYAAWNWSKGILYSRVYAALLRHLFAWFAGQEKDQESGLSHLDHAGCCLMFLQHYHEHPERYQRFDDRPNRAEAERAVYEMEKLKCAPVPYPIPLQGEDLERAKQDIFADRGCDPRQGWGMHT